MRLITFATYREAKASLELFEAKLEAPSLYSSSIGTIAITGMGPDNTKYFLESLDLKIESILNIGLSGALKGFLDKGSIYPIARTTWHQNNNPTLLLKNEGLHLATCSLPQYTSELQDRYDLVDMEGYSVAAFADAKQIPCELYKLISDYCSQSSSKEIRDAMDTHSKIMANFLNNRK